MTSSHITTLPARVAHALNRPRQRARPPSAWIALARQRPRQRLALAGLVLLYIAWWGVSGLHLNSVTDLDTFFLPSARIALAGYPLYAYTLRYHAIFPNANGPLGLAPLIADAALAQRLGWLDQLDQRTMVVMATYAVFSLLLAREAMLAVDRLRGQRVTGIQRLIGYALFACAPVLWTTVLSYGHIEHPMMLWLALVSVRAFIAGRGRTAGFAMGLALLTRTTALLYIPPLLALALVNGRRQDVLRFMALCLSTTALVLLPFVLVDPADVLYSLVTFRGIQPVRGGSIWAVTIDTPYTTVAQHTDGILIACFLLLLCIAAVRRHPPISLDDRSLYGVLMLAASSLPLLFRSVWPYYFLEPYVFAAIWALGAHGSWTTLARWLPLLAPTFFLDCAELAAYGAPLAVAPTTRLREGIAIFAIASLFLLVTGTIILRSRPRAP